MKRLMFFFCLISIINTLPAQVAPPRAFNYIGVARTSQGNLMSNDSISIQFSILKTSASGNAVYIENQYTRTDTFGSFNLKVGMGIAQSGVFDSINWSNDNYFLKVGFDSSGGSNFTTMGTTQLLSVPYALYAQNTSKVVTSNFGGFNHYIGELYGGGVIFYLYKDSLGQEHGLIASLTDLSSAYIWSNIDTSLIGTNAESSWNGKVNTTAIIAQAGQTSSAALLCTNYNGGGFNDWYLPSLTELNLLSSHRFLINKTLTGLGPLNVINGTYWCSTETSSATYAYEIAMGANVSTYQKSIPACRVRAIRNY